MSYTLSEIKRVAKGLLSEGDNPEYDRGLCELIADLTVEADDLPNKALRVARELDVKSDIYG